MATRAAVSQRGYRLTPALAVLRRQPGLAVDVAVGADGDAGARDVPPSPPPRAGRGHRLWALMCVATMLPSATPAVDYGAHSSPSWRRGRAVAGFVAVYLGIWIAYGAVALALAGLMPAPGACVGSCWALMLAMVLVTSGHLLWMALVARVRDAEEGRRVTEDRRDADSLVGEVLLPSGPARPPPRWRGCPSPGRSRSRAVVGVKERAVEQVAPDRLHGCEGRAPIQTASRAGSVSLLPVYRMSSRGG